MAVVNLQSMSDAYLTRNIIVFSFLLFL